MRKISCDRILAPIPANPPVKIHRWYGQVLEHRRYSGSCLGGRCSPAPCVPPSQVSPVTGSLHEHKTPAFTATGKSPGLKPGFLITAPDGSPSVITGDTMQHILFKTPRVIRRENGSSGHIFHLQVQSSTLFGKCQPQTIPDHASRLHPAKDAGGCGIYSFSLALRSFWRNW